MLASAIVDASPVLEHGEFNINWYALIVFPSCKYTSGITPKQRMESSYFVNYLYIRFI